MKLFNKFEINIDLTLSCRNTYNLYYFRTFCSYCLPCRKHDQKSNPVNKIDFQLKTMPCRHVEKVLQKFAHIFKNRSEIFMKIMHEFDKKWTTCNISLSLHQIECI